MKRINWPLLIYYGVVYLLLQIPLLHKLVLFDIAFGFFYIGFLLFYPLGQPPISRLVVGFLTGLFIDVFSNTPGLHAGVCTFVMLIRDNWLKSILEYEEKAPNLTLYRLKFRGFWFYVLPLIFVHHTLIFWIEYGTFSGIWMTFDRILASTLFSFFIVVLINLVIVKRLNRIWRSEFLG